MKVSKYACKTEGLQGTKIAQIYGNYSKKLKIEKFENFVSCLVSLHPWTRVLFPP